MRSRPHSEIELVESFENALDSVLHGGGISSGNGMDTETDEALWAIARAYPEVPGHLVRAARDSFAAQLDGSNARRHREHLAAQIEEMRRMRDE